MRRALAAGLAALLLPGCVGDGGPKGDARRGGVIRIAYGSPPDSLDPAVASTPVSREALWLVYTPPLTYRRSSTELVPGLAEEMPKTSDEGRTYTFTFRRGLQYSNGSPLHASDFARTVRRVRALRSPGAALFDGVAAIETNDRTRTVRVRLERPNSSFPYVLATTYAGLVPRTTPVRVARAEPPPGIGPYAIAQLRRGGGFVMRRNADFSLRGVPSGNVDEVVASIVPDSARAARAVIDGRLDYMRDPPPDSLLPELRSKYKDRYDEHPTASRLAFVLDSRREPFDEVSVRRAVAYAVDVPDLQRLLSGRLDAGCTLLPAGVPGYDKPDSCPYGDQSAHADLEKARSLVDRSGAVGARVAVRAPGGEAGRRVVRYYAGALRKIGLDAQVAGPGRRAQTWLVDRSPELPHPASFFSLVTADDPLLAVDVERLRLLPLGGATERDWGRLDSRVVDRAYLAPFGSNKQSTFLSERLDFENCSRFSPIYGNDYSSFCLK